MQWPSPWGRGFPGWHLECSAMSMKYLGQTFDIHGGGMENKFPHHECEIAQSEAATGVQFARTWTHNNMVTVDGQKMGKSLNNFITLKQVFNGAHERLTRSYDPAAVRQLVLNSHYRSPLDFSDAALYAAQSGYDKITATVKALRARIKISPSDEAEADPEIADKLKQLTEKFETAMNDDLNTSVAVSVMFELVRVANEVLEQPAASAQTLKAIDDLFTRLGGDCLGIVKDRYAQAGQDQEQLIDSLMEIVIEQRHQARKRNDFTAADDIRSRLNKAGIVLEDKPDGTTWRLS